MPSPLRLVGVSLGLAALLSGCAVSKPGSLATGGAVAPPSAAATGPTVGPIGDGPDDGGPTAPTSVASAGPSTAGPVLPTTETGASGLCLDQAAQLSPAQQAAAITIVGVPATGDPAPVASLKPGGVLLLGRHTGGVAGVKATTDKIRAAVPHVLVAASQGGGASQQLTGGGFDALPEASAQGKLDPATLRTHWTTWGRQLAQAGINLNLGPAADVPSATQAKNAAAWTRAYGTDAPTVAAGVGSVLEGLQAAEVRAAVLHFPGLGELGLDAEAAGPAADPTTSLSSPNLQPYRAAAASGADAFTISTLTYPQIDGTAPAVFSAKTMQLLREDLRFPGVIVSGDLAAKSLAATPVEQRGVAFVRAGGDAMVVSDQATAAKVIAGLAAAAASDQAVADRLREATSNVLGLKSDAGIGRCVAAKG